MATSRSQKGLKIIFLEQKNMRVNAQCLPLQKKSAKKGGPSREPGFIKKSCRAKGHSKRSFFFVKSERTLSAKKLELDSVYK